MRVHIMTVNGDLLQTLKKELELSTVPEFMNYVLGRSLTKEFYSRLIVGHLSH